MRPFKIFPIFALVAATLAGCEDRSNEPIANDGTPPGKLTNVEWVATPGGADITYDLPHDSDLLLAEAVYTNKAGVKFTFKSSLYSNTIPVKGIGDTDTYRVALYAVDSGENRSEPVYVDITPATPPVQLAYQSLDVVEDFGGITISFDNAAKANLVFEVFTQDAEGVLYNVDSFYTALQRGSFSIRGFLDTPREFRIRVRDEYDNYSETFADTFTPVFEVLLDKSRFTPLLLPGDSPCTAWDGDMTYIWDGRISADSDGRTGAHTGSDGTTVPKYFTFDMGVNAKLSRFTLWQIQDDKHFYNDVSPRRYEVWGCTDTPPSDGSWDGWVKLLEMENIKPSGYPVGSLSEDDRIAARAGDSANFARDLPEVRYIRIKSLQSWAGNSNMTFTELSFWGDDGSSTSSGR